MKEEHGSRDPRGEWQDLACLIYGVRSRILWRGRAAGWTRRESLYTESVTYVPGI